MRSITNEELLLIAGGDTKEENVQVVEITGKRMNAMDMFFYTIDNWGSIYDMTNWRKLQLAYEAANETGKAVEVEISDPVGSVDSGIGLKEGETKYKLIVEPADYLKRK